jgi:hypothetical protein
MKRIKLSNANKYTIVDDEDYERAKAHIWRMQKAKDRFYVSTAIKNPDGKWRYMAMHRFIMGLTKDDRTLVDHRDGNGFNNRKSNLRLATTIQNAMNKKTPASNTSGYKGVWWDRDKERWKSEIKVDGKKICLGSFSDKRSAAKAYNSAARKYFGEFAKLNKV